MLEIQRIREDAEPIVQALEKRGIPAREWIARVTELDQHRRKLQVEFDQLQSESKKISREIGQLIKQGLREEAASIQKKTAEYKETLKDLQARMNDAASELDEALYQIPNTPNTDVPAGQDEEDNKEVFRSGEVPELHDSARPHWELAATYDLIDFDLGSKISGAGFPVYLGKGARYQRALINYFLDRNIAAGYREIQPPLLINEDSGKGTGQLPDKEGQMYVVTEDQLYLIPTAEVPVTNIYRDRILEPAELPIKLTAYTPCFRREAGSYGAHVRGLNRLHQFDKVELVQITEPGNSYDTLDGMVEHVKGILEELELPYRILNLCAGDLGFTSAKTYDFEVYSAAQERWLEVSSVSNFETYQANRLKLRYRGEDGKTRLAHTLNGSSLALPRVMAALLENFQTEDGINIPLALQPYTGFARIEKS